MKPHVVAIIPARGGSKGIPKKNIRLLAGKPLIAHTIEQARASGVIDRIVVSTDDEEIAAVARKYGAEVPFMRPAELAQDLTPTEPVLQHAVEWLEEKEGYRVDVVVFFQLTDVFRTPEMIVQVVQRLLEEDELDSVFIAYQTHKNFWRKLEGKWVRLAPDLAYGPRQTKQPVYREDTGLACATRGHVVRAGRRIGDRVDIVATKDDKTSIDIHDEFDLWLAEKILTEWSPTSRRE
jgi:CMP-N-acetylneuraminic acid synthetase